MSHEPKALASAAKRRLHSTLIALSNRLDKPYPDDERWTPWTRFVLPMIDVVDSAIDELAARVEKAEAELERLRDA